MEGPDSQEVTLDKREIDYNRRRTTHEKFYG